MNETKQRIIFLGKLSFLLFLLSNLLAIAGLDQGTPAAAQAIDENWTNPVNLSHSGSATNPRLVIDASGQYHVLWTDLFAGFVYMTGNGIEWSTPEGVRLPFAGYEPILLADDYGNIHAFWLDNSRTSTGGTAAATLYHSQVKTENFANSHVWTRPVIVAGHAVGADATIDRNGRLHVSIIQPLETGGLVPGIYYLNSDVLRRRWSAPVLLYESPYFRSLKREIARVSIAYANPTDDEAGHIYVAWDNTLRERVYAARSVDGGDTWDEPFEVDAPVDGTLASGPSKIVIEAQGENVLMIWQTARSGASCLQYSQWSTDGGETWEPRKRMFEEIPGCPEDNQVILGEGGALYLLSTIHTQVYLLAWDGARWSNPQPQLTLGGFMDPDTYRSVEFECRQPVLVNDAEEEETAVPRLYIIGCDAGGSQDIWLTSRELRYNPNWFADAPLWEELFSVYSSQSQVLTPVLLVDQADRMHALWSQSTGTQVNGLGMTIYHARRESGQWSRPEAVLASPAGKAEQPAAALNSDGKLLAVWSGGESGEIYFSEVQADRAVVPAAWTEPVRLPMQRLAGGSPDILVDPRGRIYVAYVIPLNEQRGVYLTWSDDGGQNWIDARMIFDAGAAGWAMVDQPRLTLAGDGQLHLIWARYSLPGGPGALGLYYANSTDGGQNWSQAWAITGKMVIWSQITTVGEQEVHRFWQEQSNGRATLWHEHSTNGGLTWTRTSPVSVFGNAIGNPTVTRDRLDHLHLLQVVNRGVSGLADQNFLLQHWVWDGERWHPDQNLDLSRRIAADISNLVAAVSNDGHLGVSFLGSPANSLTGTETSLFFTSRLLNMPSEEPATLPSLPPFPTVQPATPAPDHGTEPTPVPTSAASSENPQMIGDLPGDPAQPGNSLTGSVVGPLVAGLIVVVVLVISARGKGLGRR